MRCVLAAAFGLALSAPVAHAQSALETVGFILLYAQKSDNRLDLTESGDALRYVNRHSDNPAENTDLLITRASDCRYTITGTLARNPNWRGKVDWEVDFSGLFAVVPEKRPMGGGFAPVDNVELKGVRVCGRPTSPPFPPPPPGAFEGVEFIHYPPAGQCRNYVETATLYDGDMILRMTAAITHFQRSTCKGRAF